MILNYAGFFDGYIIPLAIKLRACGVFGCSGDEYLTYAERNRMEWQARGQEVVQEMLQKAERLMPRPVESRMVPETALVVADIIVKPMAEVTVCCQPARAPVDIFLHDATPLPPIAATLKASTIVLRPLSPFKATMTLLDIDDQDQEAGSPPIFAASTTLKAISQQSKGGTSSPVSIVIPTTSLGGGDAAALSLSTHSASSAFGRPGTDDVHKRRIETGSMFFL